MVLIFKICKCIFYVSGWLEGLRNNHSQKEDETKVWTPALGKGAGLSSCWYSWEGNVGFILKERGCLALILCIRDHWRVGRGGERRWDLRKGEGKQQVRVKSLYRVRPAWFAPAESLQDDPAAFAQHRRWMSADSAWDRYLLGPVPPGASTSRGHPWHQKTCSLPATHILRHQAVRSVCHALCRTLLGFLLLLPLQSWHHYLSHRHPQWVLPLT